MSRIDELIKELCPEGVEDQPLGTLVEILDHLRKPITKSSRTPGQYPYFGANGIQDWVDGWLFEGTFLLIGEDGSVLNPDGSPILTWAEGRIWVNNHAHVVGAKSLNMLLRFLYHYLGTADISTLVSGGSRVKLTQAALRRIPIPVPPVPVQEEIVRILDTFTELEAELKAELKARTTQYEETRNRLMAFDDVEGHPLSGLIRELCPERVQTQELSSLVIRHSGTAITAIKMRQLDSPVGEIRVFAGGNTVATVPVDSIPIGDVIETPSVIVKSRGNIGFDYFDRPFSHKSELWSYSSRDSRLNIRFLFHYLESQKFQLHALARSKSVKLPQLSVRDTDGLKIPLPPATIQDEIVRILDSFDSLVSDLTSGLPAEIAARRKQYEHYRDKLLSFEKLAS